MNIDRFRSTDFSESYFDSYLSYVTLWQ